VRALRPPVVVGLSRHVGTSTLAAALHATDAGLLRPGTAGEADILVGRADEPSSRHLAGLACAPTGPRPVLVLAAAPDLAMASPLPVRGFVAVVVLPQVGRWATAPDARGEAGAVLALPPEDLPLDVGPYAAALHRLVRTLTGSGLLGRATPPSVNRPTTGPLWRGLRPLSHHPAVAPAPLVVRPGLDDDSLEAEPVRVPAGRAG
jgi:hypothetical protein